jgi:hypothetical protein
MRFIDASLSPIATFYTDQISQDLVDGEFIQSWHRRLVFYHQLITLSALASTFGGIVTPICLAAFRFTENHRLKGGGFLSV